MYIGSTGPRGLHHLVSFSLFFSFLFYLVLAFFCLNRKQVSEFCWLHLSRSMKYWTMLLMRLKLDLLQRLRLCYLQTILWASLTMVVGYGLSSMLKRPDSFGMMCFANVFTCFDVFWLQIPIDMHPVTKKSALETVLTVIWHKLATFVSNFCLVVARTLLSHLVEAEGMWVFSLCMLNWVGDLEIVIMKVFCISSSTF